MMTVYQTWSRLLPAAGSLLLLASCAMPPREAWQIVQRDGLLTYWSREYNPVIAPSRYLNPIGSPLRPSRSTHAPYRPEYSENRYLASSNTSPYRPPTTPRPSSRPQVRTTTITETTTVRTEPVKIPWEPSKSVTKTVPLPNSLPAPTIKPSMDTLPYGTPVPGRPGMVNSPFATQLQLVDVTGMAPGEAVKDPYSGKLFRVPPTMQAAAEKSQTTPEPPAASPEKHASEAKSQP